MNQRLVAALLAIIGLVVGVYAAIVIAPPENGISSNSAEYSNVEYMQTYPQPRELTDFALTSHKNLPFTKEDVLDKWTLLFLGYTYCPDICPTTLAALNNAYDKIKQATSGEPIQVVFISVDPKRDSIERLNEYMNFFNPEFIGATGEHAELFPLVRSMGMMYAMTESTDSASYLVDHSASIVVLNKQAQVIGRFKAQHKPGSVPISDTQQIISDLPRIVGNH